MQLPPAFAPTIAQQAAMAGATTIMLLLGMIVPGFYVNLALSADDVGGVIMPPGMIMDFNTPAEAMRSMGAVHPTAVTYRAPSDARGDQSLKPSIQSGVKVFDIETSVIRWNILPDVSVHAFAYNGQIPGPRLELTQGDQVRINFRKPPARNHDRSLAWPDFAKRNGWAGEHHSVAYRSWWFLHLRIHS
jgi:FtsP/CotA-like multicopper oxidase with cupredoxin domain